jgi:glycerol-3-phosphate acyltransferase PlsY
LIKLWSIFFGFGGGAGVAFLAFIFAKMADTFEASGAGLGAAAALATGGGVASSSSSGAEPL